MISRRRYQIRMVHYRNLTNGPCDNEITVLKYELMPGDLSWRSFTNICSRVIAIGLMVGIKLVVEMGEAGRAGR